MKRITLAVALALITSAAPAVAQTPGPSRQPMLTVVGSGSVDRAPDQAMVTFTISTNDPDAVRATSANNSAYSALQAKMRAVGLPSSALKTTSYNVSYNPRPDRPNPQFNERYGYVVSRSVEVTTDRTDQVGAVIDAGVQAGATSVGAVMFGVKDQRGAYRAALASAIADADAQAHALADAAHLRLGHIVSLSPAIATPIRPLAMAGRVAAAAPVPTEIEPSDLTVRAQVTVSYAISP